MLERSYHHFAPQEALEHFTAAHTHAVVVYEPKQAYYRLECKKGFGLPMFGRSAQNATCWHLGRVCFETNPHVLLKLDLQL